MAGCPIFSGTGRNCEEVQKWVAEGIQEKGTGLPEERAGKQGYMFEFNNTSILH